MRLLKNLKTDAEFAWTETLAKLAHMREIVVEDVEREAPVVKADVESAAKAIDDMTKQELMAYAKEVHHVSLDMRQKVAELKDQVKTIESSDADQ